jgi:uncharacterized protein YciI
MFVILLDYVKPIEEIERLLTPHREFLDRYYAKGRFICSGPLKPRTGGLILCNASDRSEVDSIIKEDPFYQNEAAEYTLVEFEPLKASDAFKGCICQEG